MIEKFERPTRTLGYYTGNEEVNSILTAPIILEGKVEGVLVTDRKEGDFEVLDRERLKEFAQQTATLIGLIRSNEVSQMAAHRFSLFHEMSKEISGRVHFEDVLDWVGETVEKIFDYDEMVLVLIKGSDGTVRRRQGYLSGLREGYAFSLDRSSSEKGINSFAGLIVKNDVTLLKEDLWKDRERTPVFFPGESPLYRSLVGTPLHAENESIGILTLLKREKNGFQEMDSQLLSLLGQMTSQTIERSKLYEKTEALAIRDGLTSLYNHRYFQETLSKWIKTQGVFSLLIVDVDKFKRLNDRYGHPAGDEVLKRISELLVNKTDDRDFVGRYGGEEFCVLSPLNGVEMAERLREEIESAEFFVEGQELNVTVSIGVAQHPRDADEKRMLIEKADQNLYLAKEGGRNRVVGTGKPASSKV
jgi:diguanylate cyclase (GGDEF)-like protein